MTSATNSEPSRVEKDHSYERSPATKMFLGLLAGFVIFYGVVLTYHVSHPITLTAVEEPDFLELCRQYCAEHGLVPTGNVKADAEAYLDAVESRQLSAPLQELLSTKDFAPAVTEDHPLIGQPALDFELTDTQGQSRSLDEFRQQGPVILVFYYGYNCSHCVAQLFAIQKDLERFRELGAEVIAISSDKPAHTREMYKEYGEFAFPVLSDPDLNVSEAWGVYVRETSDQQEDMLHGTFVINGDGQVVFANCGYEPFVDNRSLLHWLNDAESAAVDSTQVAVADSSVPSSRE